MTPRTHRIRRALAATAALAAALAGVLVGVAPASADDAHPLEYSADGITWSTTPLASVFPAGFVFVPGDSLSSTFYIRNNRSVPSSLVLVLTDISYDDTELGQALTISASDFGTGGWGARPIADIEKCAALTPRRDLAPGQAIGIRIDASLDADLTDGQGQTGHAGFRVLAGVADMGAPVTPEGCPTVAGAIAGFPGAAGGTIASTGVQSPYAATTIAGIALGVGCFLILMARRRRREERESTR